MLEELIKLLDEGIKILKLEAEFQVIQEEEEEKEEEEEEREEEKKKEQIIGKEEHEYGMFHLEGHVKITADFFSIILYTERIDYEAFTDKQIGYLTNILDNISDLLKKSFPAFEKSSIIPGKEEIHDNKRIMLAISAPAPQPTLLPGFTILKNVFNDFKALMDEESINVEMLTSGYTIEQAIKEEKLIEMDKIDMDGESGEQLRLEAGIILHILTTSSLYARILPTKANLAQGQSLKGRYWDILSLYRLKAKSISSPSIPISFIVKISKNNVTIGARIITGDSVILCTGDELPIIKQGIEGLEELTKSQVPTKAKIIKLSFPFSSNTRGKAQARDKGRFRANPEIHERIRSRRATERID